MYWNINGSQSILHLRGDCGDSFLNIFFALCWNSVKSDCVHDCRFYLVTEHVLLDRRPESMLIVEARRSHVPVESAKPSSLCE